MDKYISGTGEEQHIDDSLMKLLEDKDKLIVSLKEASTKRDILNENRIKKLAEENSKRLAKIKEYESRIEELENVLQRKDIEIELTELKYNKTNELSEQFQKELEEYKTNINTVVSDIKRTVQKELQERENYRNKIVQQLKDNVKELQDKTLEIEDFYKGILSDIAEKQSRAKGFIRHALNDLQDALDLLDLNHAALLKPTKLHEEFRNLVSYSNELFSQHDSNFGGGIQNVIDKIDTVNINLSNLGRLQEMRDNIEGLKNGTKTIKIIDGEEIIKDANDVAEQNSNIEQGSKDKSKEKDRKEKEHQGKDQGEGQSKGKDKLDHTEDLKQGKTFDSDKGSGQGQGSAGQESGQKADESQGKETAKQGQAGEPDKQHGKKDAKGSSTKAQEENNKSESNQDQTNKMGLREKAKRMKEEDADSSTESKKSGLAARASELRRTAQKQGQEKGPLVAIMEKESQAPYDWLKLSMEAPLNRYRDMLLRAMSYEKKKLYENAIQQYKTILEQPIIQRNNLSQKMLKEQIAHVESKIRSKILLNE